MIFSEFTGECLERKGIKVCTHPALVLSWLSFCDHVASLDHMLLALEFTLYLCPRSDTLMDPVLSFQWSGLRLESSSSVLIQDTLHNLSGEPG